MLAFLKSLGVTQVVMAVNGLEGVSAATRESFDLVLMDAQMPVMDGYEATSILRGKGLKLPIVGVSAGALEEERQTALSAGMNDYVHKPISKLALCGAIQRVLAGV
jgi:CheY-like chemotaxis protein